MLGPQHAARACFSCIRQWTVNANFPSGSHVAEHKRSPCAGGTPQRPPRPRSPAPPHLPRRRRQRAPCSINTASNKHASSRLKRLSRSTLHFESRNRAISPVLADVPLFADEGAIAIDSESLSTNHGNEAMYLSEETCNHQKYRHGWKLVGVRRTGRRRRRPCATHTCPGAPSHRRRCPGLPAMTQHRS